MEDSLCRLIQELHLGEGLWQRGIGYHGRIELGQEDGLEDAVIIERLQKKAGLSLEKAKLYLDQFRKQFV